MHPHGHHPILLILFIGIFFLGAISSIVDFSDLHRSIRLAIVDSINALRLSQKDVYMPMGYSKGEWSKVLSGEKHVSLDRFAKAPSGFLFEFLPRYMAIVARNFMNQVREDVVIERPVRHDASVRREA